jgi:NAD+ diphosphatase
MAADARPSHAGQPPPISFAGAALDRAPVQRRSAEWLAAQLGDVHARALLVSERGARVERAEDGARLALARPDRLVRSEVGEPAAAPGPASNGVVLLGLREGGQPLFAADVGALAADGLPGELLGLRELTSELSPDELGLVAYASALLNWHRRHGFCAVCGHATEIADGGHERRCPSCGAHHFPRTDPVVIMRVARGDQLLLGHKPEWPEWRYSVLAGFVEPGETLEQAVQREVLEESGIEVEDVRYVASQPWPFPSSLMLGFEATALPGREPAVGDEELEDVRWFSREQICAAARGEGDLLLPPRFSIARQLIDAWL